MRDSSWDVQYLDSPEFISIGNNVVTATDFLPVFRLVKKNEKLDYILEIGVTNDNLSDEVYPVITFDTIAGDAVPATEKFTFLMNPLIDQAWTPSVKWYSKYQKTDFYKCTFRLQNDNLDCGLHYKMSLFGRHSDIEISKECTGLLLDTEHLHYLKKVQLYLELGATDFNNLPRRIT